jgi:3-hydroxyisobutyrate dehydrogenase-like beta-hydroxyacid dehydrogenase
MKVAVLGMGAMGRAITSRLLTAGDQLRLWNRSAGKASELVARGAVEFGSPREAAEGAEVVLCSLTDDAAVRGVLLDGDSPSLPVDLAVVDCSTVSPDTARLIANAYRGLFVSAPIAGTPAMVEAGDALFIVGGPPALVDQLVPLWSSLTALTQQVGGDVGAALVVKLVVNYLLMAEVAVLAEAVSFGQSARLPDELIIEILKGSVSSRASTKVEGIVNGDHEGSFPPGMAAKDVHIFLETAPAEPKLSIAAAVADRYDEAVRSGIDRSDFGAIVELLRPQRLKIRD